MNITYKDKKYQLVTDDPKCTRVNHCKMCAFDIYCEKYIDENSQFACGCDFQAESVYFIENI